VAEVGLTDDFLSFAEKGAQGKFLFADTVPSATPAISAFIITTGFLTTFCQT
jgi:hypothetical protein